MDFKVVDIKGLHKKPYAIYMEVSWSSYIKTLKPKTAKYADFSLNTLKEIN